MAQQRQQDKPGRVALSLDSLEREGEQREPFVVALGGKTITFADPEELVWNDLVDIMGNPGRFLDVVVPARADRDRILAARLPAWKMKQVVDAYWQHYGVNPGEAQAAS